jgi:hypothetical protein
MARNSSCCAHAFTCIVRCKKKNNDLKMEFIMKRKVEWKYLRKSQLGHEKIEWQV